MRERYEVAIALSSLVRRATNKKHKLFIDGKLRLIPQTLKLRGGVSWDTALSPKIQIQEEGNWNNLFPLQNFPTGAVTAFLSCPSCEKCVSTLSANFQWGDLESKCSCHFCSRAHPAYKWKCQCGVPWYTCANHRFCCKQPSHTESTKRNQQDQTCPPNKKLRAARALKRTPSKEYEYLLGEDKEKASAKKARLSSLVRGIKRKAKITLSDKHPSVRRPTLLGPILSNRFGGASSSSSR